MYCYQGQGLSTFRRMINDQRWNDGRASVWPLSPCWQCLGYWPGTGGWCPHSAPLCPRAGPERGRCRNSPGGRGGRSTAQVRHAQREKEEWRGKYGARREEASIRECELWGHLESFYRKWWAKRDDNRQVRGSWCVPTEQDNSSTHD